MNLPRLSLLTSQDQREVNGLLRRIQSASARDELATTFIELINRCLPGEMAGWGEMTPDYQHFTGMAITPDYVQPTTELVEPITELLPHHPALREVGWQGARDCPHRISDFESYWKFKDNPLHREAYRHLDANHQIAFSPGCFGGTAFVISLNRKQRDYSDRECQKFHLLGGQVGVLLHDLHRRELLQRQLDAISRLWPLTPEAQNRLTAPELRRIAHWANDTDSPPSSEGERKALYRILSKLELDSKAQLLALLHELRPDG